MPGHDTPLFADGNPAGGDLAEAALNARSAWRSITSSIAATPHVRVSKDGGRTYPARHARPLPAEPPGQPCTVPVYDPGSATGRMLALDLDPGRTRISGDVGHQAAELAQLLERHGPRSVADVAPSGGRHVYVLFSSPLPWRELRDLVRAITVRFPTVDPAPMCSLGGQISPPGSRHKSGGWRTLSTPLSEARAAIEHPNGPEVWAALLDELAAELQAVTGAPVDTEAEMDNAGVPWVPRLGGRAPLRAELDSAARTGRWDRSATLAALRRAWPSWPLPLPAAGSWPRCAQRSTPAHGRAWRRCTTGHPSPAGWTGFCRTSGENQSPS